MKKYYPFYCMGAVVLAFITAVIFCFAYHPKTLVELLPADTYISDVEALMANPTPEAQAGTEKAFENNFDGLNLTIKFGQNDPRRPQSMYWDIPCVLIESDDLEHNATIEGFVVTNVKTKGFARSLWQVKVSETSDGMLFTGGNPKSELREIEASPVTDLVKTVRSDLSIIDALNVRYVLRIQYKPGCIVDVRYNQEQKEAAKKH